MSIIHRIRIAIFGSTTHFRYTRKIAHINLPDGDEVHARIIQFPCGAANVIMMRRYTWSSHQYIFRVRRYDTRAQALAYVRRDMGV